MPSAPYLVFGFDVDPANPNASQIMQQVRAGFPPLPGVGSLGVDDVYLVEVPPSNAYAAYHIVAHYLWQMDQTMPALRWFVQLCDRDNISVG